MSHNHARNFDAEQDALEPTGYRCGAEPRELVAHTACGLCRKLQYVNRNGLCVNCQAYRDRLAEQADTEPLSEIKDRWHGEHVG
jgi:hypothetical protein